MSLKLAIAAVVAFSLVAPAIAAEAPPEELTPAAVEQIQLAAALARYGESRHDPILLIAAARIARGVAPEGPPSAAKLPTLDEMLESAKTYAEGDAVILGMIDDVKAEQSKGYCYSSRGLGWC